MTRASWVVSRVRRAALAIGLVHASASVSYAQTQAPQATLAGIFARLRAGAQIVNFATVSPAVDQRLNNLQSYFTSVNAMGLTLDELTDLYTHRRADLPTVARWDRRSPSLVPGVVDSLVALNIVAHGQLLAALQGRMSRDSLNVLYKPVDDFGTEVLVKAKAANQEKLRRFSIKYGPDSPHLNLAEVGLNYLGQLFIPGLLPSEDGWPTPFELVATYRTTDLTAAQSAAGHLTGHVVTSAQLGVRMYGFSETCGKGGRFADLLNPCQSSAGAFVLGREDSPFAKVWGSGARGGVYLARGKYHLGYVVGAEKRVVFGVDQQLVPYLF
ncbi:MAG: hypothetical protein ABJE10_01510 [bacterium]